MTDTLHSHRVRVSVDRDGVAQVTLARPDKMNALDGAMFDGLLGALAQLQNQPGLRAVVLHGEGRAFCSGLDKDSFAAMAGARHDDGALADLLTRRHGPANAPQQVVWGWRQLPVPVIAAVHGVAFGGGLQLALGADLRFVRPDAQLSVLEMQWGLVPDMAGCVLLTELARPDVVRDLVFSARRVSGDEALALGLATRVCDDPLAEARAWAAQTAARSPDAVRAAKRLLNGASPVAAPAVLLAESLEQQRLIGSPNQVEAVRAGLEKRAPTFA
jgi:enoyl-CoA hydratase/carnithine racemase